MYEDEKPHLTVQHVTPILEYCPLPAAIPSEMEKDWEMVVGAMSATDMLSSTDLPVLETAFIAMYQQREAVRQLHMDGPMLTDAKGQVYPHPSIKMMNDCAKTILSCSKALNWDLNTRLRTPVPERPTEDPNDPARLLEA